MLISHLPVFPGHSQNMEHYRDYDYTEQVPDDDKVQLLEQKILDNEREKRNSEYIILYQPLIYY